MEAYGDAIVGTLGVEHRKRLTIGVELAAKPKLLLFLDEPTSGLDSQSAMAIMKFLRELADSGQAILCTIHQPSYQLFQFFDRLLLLRKGGQTVYFGNLGRNSQTLIDYFERNGARPCGAVTNPYVQYDSQHKIPDLLKKSLQCGVDVGCHRCRRNGDQRNQLA